MCTETYTHPQVRQFFPELIFQTQQHLSLSFSNAGWTKTPQLMQTSAKTSLAGSGTLSARLDKLWRSASLSAGF